MHCDSCQGQDWTILLYNSDTSIFWNYLTFPVTVNEITTEVLMKNHVNINIHCTSSSVKIYNLSNVTAEIIRLTI